MIFSTWPSAFAPLILACFCANAAASESAEPIAACMIEAAAFLKFNGNIYVHSGNDTLEKSFGTSDAAGKIPIKSRTRFNIASAGKMFTAVGIGRLVDRGLIAFDAPISRYLAQLRPEVGAITVAELLNHTSGLGNYFDPRNSEVIEKAATATDLLPVALAEALAFPPGSKRAYSNSGFVVLGAIIERASGQSYTNFIQQEILKPLHMRKTTFGANDGAVPMSRMSPQGLSKNSQPIPPVFLRSSPAGGIYSTVEDIAIFMAALNDGRLVSAKTRFELWSPRRDPGGGDKVYGYGFNVRPEFPQRVGHGGGAPGINVEIALYPELGRQIITLSNNDPPVATRLLTVIEKAIFAADPSVACNEAVADLPAPSPI